MSMNKSNVKATCKVQASKSNVTINIPKEIRNEFPIEKGDILLITVIDGKLVIEK